MKVLKTIQLTIFVLFSLTSISQSVDVQIQDMVLYHNDPNNTNVSNCGTINLKSNFSLRTTFTVKMTKSSDVGGNGTLKIYSKKSISSNAKMLAWKNIFLSDWPNAVREFDFVLQESDFCTSGGTLYAAYEPSPVESYKSCEYPVIKNDNPTFALNKTSISVPCGSTLTYDFNVINVNCSPGVLSYTWNVGNGWKQNGIPVSGSFTTSSNSISLVPNTYPLSNISVTPKLNGVAQQQKVVIVSLAPFTSTSATINGNTSMCEPSMSSVYSIANLPSGQTVTWSTSNTAIATVSSTIGSSTTVNKVSNGTFNLIARVTNSCGQFIDVPLSIRIGGLPQIRVALENNPNLYDTANFYLVGVNSNLNEQGINSIVWERVPPINSAYLFLVQDGDTGGSAHGPGNNWSFEAKVTVTNACGPFVYYFTVTPPPPGECDTNLRLSSNPMKSGNANRVIIDPCGTSKINNSQLKNYKISIFNYYGEEIYSKSQQETEFDISNLKKGLYIVRFKTKNGNILSKNLIIE